MAASKHSVCKRFASIALRSLVLLWFCGATSVLAEGPALQLHRGDHVIYIGNTMADRMQHHGWLETYLHALHPELDLTFRNLGYAGDELKTRPRAENFGDADQWLTKCGADVVFCFFGRNEALKGNAGLPAFEADLAELIDHMRAQNYNGEAPPRLVVFSPIAHENLHSPDLPDGAAQNANLATYTEAMRTVCSAKEVTFVDLFTPTKQIYATADKSLTMNGIHLLDHGNKTVAQVILAELLPNKSLPSNVDRLREAVLDKNYHWFSRYRVVDEYNVFGGRSQLAWHGQSNGDVMRREMEILDVMTENRDQRVWAVAKGGDLKVLDDNLPAEEVVKTNKEGPLPGGAWPYLGGEEAIDKMTVAEGMEVNLFASEEMFPRLVNPVQIAVDTNSRLWASVWPSYPHWNPVEPRRDALVILPDENGDGVADDLIVFADELNSITGFEFWNGGVLVAAPPEIWFLKDTDGDDKADVKIRMLQGVSSADTHHSANAVMIGPDGWMYWSRGIFNIANFETPTSVFRSGSSGVHRFNPRTFEFEFHFPIGPNPHGDVFDRWGYQFANDGTSGTGSYVNIGKGIGNKQWFEKRVRPVAATGILSSGHFPEQNQGNFLIANTIGFLGVLQHEVHYNGADITATEVEPILFSSDENFRPCDLEVGGDGALYVADWHNTLIGHMQHNMRDPNRDHEHGRIYRVTAKGRPLTEPAKMRGKPIAEVCERFFAVDNGTRYRARLELSSRDADEIATEVIAFAEKLNPHSAPRERDEAQALLEVLWVLEEHRLPNLGLVERTFAANEPRVRAAAIRTLGHWAGRIEGWEPLLTQAAGDESPLVRAEVVKAAAEFADVTATEILFEVASRPTDPELDALLSYAMQAVRVDAMISEMLASGRPLSPAARAYILRKATIADLHKLEKSADVYRAILSRQNASPQDLADALAGLAESLDQSPVMVLMELIDEQRSNPQGNVIGLGTLLVSQSPADLQGVRQQIESIALGGETPQLKRLGYAAWIAAAGPGDAFLAATKSKDSLRDFLDAVPTVDESIREQLFPKVLPLISELPRNLQAESVPAENLSLSGGETLHDVAIRALTAIPGHETEKFESLAALVAQGQHRPAAIAALRSVPQESRAAALVRPLLDNLVGYLSEMPVRQRTGAAAMDAIALAKSLASQLPPDVARDVEARLGNLDVRVIAVGTVSHRMIFDKESLAVQAGKPVEFRFSNTDAMPHNFAIVLPGALEEVGELAEATGRDADAMLRQYIPDSDKVLLASNLLQPGESQALSFDVPSEPGVYPYVCTYPGHWRRMYGALYVVEDLAAYQADPEGYLAAAQLPVQDELLRMNTRVHEWTFDELAADVEHLPAGRSWEVGRELFKVASCTGCHKLADEGSVFGPDLAALEEKKQSPAAILLAILDSSKDIDEKFQSNVFLFDDGRVLTGMIVEETDDEIQIVINPLAKDKPTVIEKDAIVDRKKSPVSLMPKGLLDKLSREEILDLVAFVYAKGNKDHAIFGGHDHHH